MHTHSIEAAKERLSKVNHDLSVARLAQQDTYDKALNRLERSITGWAEANMPDIVRALREESGASYLVTSGSEATDGGLFYVADEIAAKLPASKREEIKRAEAQMQEADNRVKALQHEASELARKISGNHGVAAGVGGLFAFGRDEIQSAREHLLRGIPVKLGAGDMFAAAIDKTNFPMGGPIDYRTGRDFPYLSETPVIAGLFPRESTEADSVTIYRQTALADQAAAVATGATKPVSTPTWEAVNLQVQTIAHTATIDNKILADLRTWENFVGREMIRGLLAALDTEVLSGSGAGAHLEGLLTNADIGVVDWDPTNDPRSKALLQGLTYVRNNAYADADVILLRPDDYEAILLERGSVYNGSTTAEKGEYLVGGPTEAPFDTLYGRRVIITSALPEFTAVVMNMGLAGALYVRQGATLEVNPYSETEWKKNQVSLRAELRAAFGLVFPKAVCKVTLL